jgi:hypothetical protein
MFYVWLHLDLYSEHVHSRNLNDFCLLPAQFCCIIVYIRKVVICAQIADQCAPWKISNGAQKPVLHALKF